MAEAKKKTFTKARTRKGDSPWTDYYDRRLRKLYGRPDLTLDEVAEMLGRSKPAIYSRASMLGISRHGAATEPKPAAKKKAQPAVKKRRSWLDWLLRR